MGSGKGSPPSPSVTTPATPSNNTDAGIDMPSEFLTKSTPKLVQERGNMRFMDNPWWGHLHDELQSMREILDAQDKEEGATPYSDAPTPDPASDLLVGDVSGVNLEHQHPDPVNVFRLWHVFLERVNPVTKVIHTPSMQRYFQEAASPTKNIPLNVEALLFAIYASAVISLEEHECMSILGYSKTKAFHKFTLGVRTSLHKVGFLVNYDLSTIQALILYMTALQGRYDRHARWVLGGVVIRLAQKLGLHRDGETMGLTPFETEMRRRVWWALILQDAKAALMSGLGHAYLSTAWWDTKEPANIDDSDLAESATEPIQSKNGPTEMISCLLGYRLAQFMISFPGLGGSEITTLIERVRNPEDQLINDLQVQQVMSRIAELESSVQEVMDKYCDTSAGPLHQFAWLMAHHMTSKMKLLVGDPSEAPDWMREKMSLPDTMFAFTVENLDQQLHLYQQVASTGFLWHLKTHFLPDIFPVFILSQLCFRTMGTLVDRAWEQTRLQYHFHPELYDMSDELSVKTGLLALRAWRHREAALTAMMGIKPEMPEFIHRIEKLVPADRSGSNSDTASNDERIKSADQAQILPEDVAALRWEPMFGAYADFANVDWDMFGSLNSDTSTLFPPPPPPQSFGM